MGQFFPSLHRASPPSHFSTPDRRKKKKKGCNVPDLWARVSFRPPTTQNRSYSVSLNDIARPCIDGRIGGGIKDYRLIKGARHRKQESRRYGNRMGLDRKSRKIVEIRPGRNSNPLRYIRELYFLTVL